MPIVLHPGQSQVFREVFIKKQHRFFTCVCSRGWGKSFFAAVAASNAVAELIDLSEYVPNKVVYVIAPTYDQVTDIYYPLLSQELGMADYAIKHSRDTGRFLFHNTVELRLISYEAIERLRGKGAYFVVMDEIRDWTKGIGAKAAWEEIIQPCVATRWSPMIAKRHRAVSAGRAIAISTPKGYDFLYDMFHFQEQDSNWKSFHFDYKTSPYLDPVEIERIRHTIDPLSFAREYMASFEESGNSVFYCFDRKTHVTDQVPPLQDWEDVHIGIDFNVGIQASSVFALRGNQMHFVDEFKGHPDTETLAQAIIGRYQSSDSQKKRKIYAYPDPTGRSRKSSAMVGVTDFSILESHGIATLAHSKSPAIVDSVAAVNRKLKTAAGEVDLYVHPRCQGLIISLERTCWVDNNPNAAVIDKSQGVEHFSDGVRYATEFLFPVLAGTKVTSRGFKF